MKLTESLQFSTTTKTIPNSKRTIKPWITTGILRCIKNRNKLQQKSRNDPFNDILIITYRRYRNHCNNLIKKLKRKYERELLGKSVNNNKLLWKNIKSISYTNNSKSPNIELLNIKSSPLDSVNFINNYFTNIGKDLAEKIQNTSNYTGKPISLNRQVNSFTLLDTDNDEVSGILTSLKTDSAPGWDNISTKFLKYIGKEVIPIVTHLANLCFTNGIFPEPLKKSVIIPVYKGGDRDDVNNYRPISILPAISKIIEKLINIRLIKYFDKYKILSKTQFGFKHGMSTENAITALTSLVTDSMDKGDKCTTVFLDLKKAFDTVSVPILIDKLEASGVRGIPLKLFGNYLSDRKQRVKVGDYLSEETNVTFGVPQGSVLGPTLFLLYINGLSGIGLNNAKVFSYADDTAVVFTGNSWSEVALLAEAGMTQIAKWLQNNLLSLNTAKTNYICFSISNRTQPKPDFKIKVHTCDDSSKCQCPSIVRLTETKYLGVVVDQRLSWYPHLDLVNVRIRKLCWIFKTLRHVVPKSVPNKKDKPRNLLNEIYMALVQSILTYCIPVWGGAAKTKFIDLERGQRALIKIMYFKNIRYSTQSLYHDSGLLSVRKLYIIKTVLKTHKLLPYNPNSSVKRRTNKVAEVPHTKTKFASRQYQYRSAHLYNKLNKLTDIHKAKSRDCKKILNNIIKTLTYEDTEALLE